MLTDFEVHKEEYRCNLIYLPITYHICLENYIETTYYALGTKFDIKRFT